MTVDKLKRKLTTIFCADVQSYSALMATDEADTLQRLQRYRAIMGELFERHDGRKVNTWGDAVIAEFSSVVEAVRCGVEIQDAIGAENRDLPKAKQMWFRIGINLGDVMQDGADLYGDGVNVASRLESLADAGGIMVSETVYDLTHRQLSFAYDFAGEQKVKGQDHPIVGYRVRMPGSNATRPQDAATSTEPPQYAKSDAAAFARSASSNFADEPAVDGSRLNELRDWFFSQPRQVRVPIAMITLFATINLLTSGFSTIWFIYPSIPFVLFLLFHFLVLNNKHAE
jgi:adenylate cyclase